MKSGDLYKLVRWPEVQKFQEQYDFPKHSVRATIDTDNGVGLAVYFIEYDWWHRIKNGSRSISEQTEHCDISDEVFDT